MSACPLGAIEDEFGERSARDEADVGTTEVEEIRGHDAADCADPEDDDLRICHADHASRPGADREGPGEEILPATPLLASLWLS